MSKKKPLEEWDDREHLNANFIDLLKKADPELLAKLPAGYTQKDLDRLNAAFWCKLFNKTSFQASQGHKHRSESAFRKYLESLKPYLTDEDIEQAIKREFPD